MGDSEPSPSCLSAEFHSEPTDSTMHYLGCTEFWKRREYFESLKDKHPGAQERIESELRRIKSLRGVLKNATDKSVSVLVKNLEDSMQTWRNNELYLGKHGIGEVKEWRSRQCWANGIPDPKFDWESTQEPTVYHPNEDVKAYLLSYKDAKHVLGLEVSGPPSGPFSDHKIPISQLLQPSNPDSDVLLSKVANSSDGSIHYLHLPANNMAVSCHHEVTW